ETVLVSVVTEETVYVANAGDSRAVYQPRGDKPAVQVTTDHKPSVPSERARILRAGATVEVDSENTARLDGVLSVSRAIGDIFLKNSGLTCIPEVYSIPTDDVDFIIMACDGLWDV
ncbi:protein phosphatase 2C family, partial [Kipferlia bialata]